MNSYGQATHNVVYSMNSIMIQSDIHGTMNGTKVTKRTVEGVEASHCSTASLDAPCMHMEMCGLHVFTSPWNTCVV